jgi:hypothetical protein
VIGRPSSALLVALDAADGVPRQFHRRDLPRLERRRTFDGGLETPFRLGQGALPLSFVSANDAQFRRSLQEQWLYNDQPVVKAHYWPT